MSSEPQTVGPINLGNPGEFTIRELAEKVLAQTGSKSQMIFKPLPEDDPLQRQPDIQLAAELLDWRPFVALPQGLQETIGYFRELLASDT